MRIIRDYINHLERQDSKGGGFPRSFWLTSAVVFAAMSGYALGSAGFRPGNTGLIILYTGMVVMSLQKLVEPVWLRIVLLPLVSLVLFTTCLVMMARGHFF